MWCPGPRNQWSFTEGSPSSPLNPAINNYHWTPTQRDSIIILTFSVSCPYHILSGKMLFCHGSKMGEWFFSSLASWALGKRQSRRSYFACPIYLCHSCPIFLPSPPTPSFLCSEASARQLWKLQSAQGFGFPGCVVMTIGALKDPKHIIGLLPSEQVQRFLVAIGSPALAWFLFCYVSNTDCTGGERVA